MSTPGTASDRRAHTRGMARQILGASRGRTALLTNAISSVGNLLLSITVARSSSLSGLGDFAIAFAVYVLIAGAVRAAVANSVLMSAGAPREVAAAAGRVLLLGLLSAGPLIALGVLADSPYLTVLGCGLPGIVLYDYIKTVQMGIGGAGRACAQECVWTVLSAAAMIPSLLHVYSGLVAFGAWVGSCALIGIAHSLSLRYRLVPHWRVEPGETKTASSFGVEYLFGAGIAQLTLIALAGVAGTPVVGALRGAGTALGPITLIAGTVPTLVIPYIARLKDGAVLSRWQSAEILTGLLLAATGPLLVGVCFLPDSVGRALLGQNWTAAHPLVPAMACELFFVLAAAVPLAGHRVERVGPKTLVLRACLTALRVPLVLLSGYLLGAQGAAVAMAVSAVVAAAVWWSSYRRLMSV